MKLLFIINLIFLSSSLKAWTLNSSTGEGFDDNKINIYIANTSCAGAGMTLSEFEDLIKSSVKHFWNSVSTSALHLDVKGLKTDIDITGDQHAAAVLKAPKNSILAGCNTSGEDFENSAILGSALSSCTGSTCRAVLILNAHSESSLPTKSDSELEAVIAHEIGHAFGLGHSEYKESLMYYSISGKYQKWLGDDDIDGVTYLYPHESELDVLGQSLLGNCGAIASTKDYKPNSPNILEWVTSMLFGLILPIFLVYYFRKKLTI